MSYFEQEIPGHRLDKQATYDLWRQLMQRWGDDTKRHLPPWFTMTLEPMPREILYSVAIKSLASVCFLVGKGALAHIMSGEEVATFFLRQQACEDFDIYVFPADMQWCIVATDELAPEVESDVDFWVMGVGQLPASMNTAQGHNIECR